ncbi:hypothetical protein AKG12_26770 [Agrobacterium sp. SUL3]|nr:hypothetical protein AKG12_26770 [Agrobacterium sp. SUL3]CUX66306.1 hypothetical protein AGR5A_pa30123 [Agrobacterium genomosp. 5 str. CFBP 6626]
MLVLRAKSSGIRSERLEKLDVITHQLTPETTSLFTIHYPFGKRMTALLDAPLSHEEAVIGIR